MVVGKSYIKTIWRGFKGSFGRFAAIFGIVALGVGFLSGLLVTTPDMHQSVDEYYDKHNTADIFIKGTMGLTEEDLEEVKSVENVKEIMPAYVIDNIVKINNRDTKVAKIYGIPLIDREDETIVNELELFEGRMPENSRECLVERKSPVLADIKIGSRIKFSRENKDYEDLEDIYEEEDFKVVGIVGNTFHFSLESEFSNVGSGKLETILYVDKDSFALEEFTDFYIIGKDTREMNSFSKEYKVYTENIKKNLEDLGEKRSSIRKREVLDKANEKLKEGFDEYIEEKEKAEDSLRKASREIDKGKEELEDAYEDLKDAEEELKEGRQSLKKENKKAKKEIENGEKELEKARIELINSEKLLKQVKLKLEQGRKELNIGLKEYEEGKRELEEGKEELLKAEKELKAGEKELNQGKKELEKAKKQILQAKTDLEDAERQYEKGLYELNSGKMVFLNSIRPLALEVGYTSPEKMMSTSHGQSALKKYLNDTHRQVEIGLREAKAGKIQIEENLKFLRPKKTELELALNQLNSQLKILEQNPVENQENIIALKTQIKILEENLNQVNKNIEELEARLIQVDNTIIELEQTLAQLPEFDFLISNWNEIQRNERRLNKAKLDIEMGWKEYNFGLEELGKSEIEIRNSEIEIKEGKKELEKNKKILDRAERESVKGLKELEKAKKELEQGEREYKSGLVQLREGQKEYKIGVKEIEDAKEVLEEETQKAIEEIEEGEKELKEGFAQYKKGIKDIKKGEREYKNAKKLVEEELAEAYEDILEAEAEIRDLDDPEWYVLDRESNMSYASFDLNAEKVAAIAKVFPIFFYLVAGLVALTTMTRMVEEERTQIGLLKALGYKKSSIIFKYILYSGLASVLGSIAGQLVGFQLIPKVIWNTYGVMFHLPDFVTDFNEKIAILSSGMAILSTLLATYFSANTALKEKPALLMLPKPPKKGKRILLERITPLWSRMSFNLKSTARNIFRYKKHFYMTVIGVSGCTALLVTGFGLRDSIKDVATFQFEELFKYELEIQLEEDLETNDISRIKNDYEEIQGTLDLFTDSGYVEFEGEAIETTLVGIENIEEISQYVVFKNRKNNQIIKPIKGENVITEKVAEVLGVEIGDIVSYENSDEEKEEFQIHRITENYLGNYLYMDRSIYEDEFRKAVETNTIYAKTEELDQNGEDRLLEKLYQNESILSAELVAQSRGTLDNLIGSINYIVLVIIVASGLLAFIVLYNLTNININERSRELATLKVLGFHEEEVAAYIFREITILAFIGTLVGLVLGKYLHQFIIVTVEDPEFMFGRDISILSYILSAGITMIFSVLVDLFMIKKLKNIKMVDSMKAND